jgi:predicted transcriptional regulator
MSFAEIAQVVGRSAQTVKNYIDSPANAELIAQKVEAAAKGRQSNLEYRAEIRARAATLASEMLLNRLEEAEARGETLPMRELIKIAADSDDRTGLGKQETRLNINADLGQRLDKAIEAKHRAGEIRAGAFGGAVVEFKKRV